MKLANCPARTRLAEVAEHRFDLVVPCDVAIERQPGVEFLGEITRAFLEALADVAEGQLRAFAAAGAGNAIGDRAVGEHSSD